MRWSVGEHPSRLIVKQDQAPARVPDDAQRQWGPTTTFNDAIAGWRENGWQDLSPTTAQRYESVWRVHIRDTIGCRRIESVGPYDVERFFRKLKADGVGRETIRYSRSVLHRACRLARKWSGNTLSNPVTDTELPVFTRAELPEPVRAPTLDEVLAILRTAESLDIRYRSGLVVIAAAIVEEACVNGGAPTPPWAYETTRSVEKWYLTDIEALHENADRETPPVYRRHGVFILEDELARPRCSLTRRQRRRPEVLPPSLGAGNRRPGSTS